MLYKNELSYYKTREVSGRVGVEREGGREGGSGRSRHTDSGDASVGGLE